jgi:hypothetical protein
MHTTPAAGAGASERLDANEEAAPSQFQHGAAFTQRALVFAKSIIGKG